MTQPKGSPQVRLFEYDAISEGASESLEYVISPEVYAAFLAAFQDISPIHVDEDYATSCGFAGRVMHGSLLNGFLSNFVGVHFPGRLSLLLSSDLRFAQPSYLGDVIRLEAVVAQKMDANRVVVLNVIFKNVTQDYLAARGGVLFLVSKLLESNDSRS
jgi:3-hydroxybutyryl-CoA dehydratase